MRFVLCLIFVVAVVSAGFSEDHDQLRREREEKRRLLSDFHRSPEASVEESLSAARVIEDRHASEASTTVGSTPSSSSPAESTGNEPGELVMQEGNCKIRAWGTPNKRLISRL